MQFRQHFPHKELYPFKLVQGTSKGATFNLASIVFILTVKVVFTKIVDFTGVRNSAKLPIILITDIHWWQFSNISIYIYIHTHLSRKKHANGYTKIHWKCIKAEKHINNLYLLITTAVFNSLKKSGLF